MRKDDALIMRHYHSQPQYVYSSTLIIALVYLKRKNCCQSVIYLKSSCLISLLRRETGRLSPFFTTKSRGEEGGGAAVSSTAAKQTPKCKIKA